MNKFMESVVKGKKVYKLTLRYFELLDFIDDQDH